MSVTVRDPMIAFNAVLALRTIRSQMPDMLDAVGGWKIHLHPCCSSSRSIFWPFHSSMLSLNSRSAPTKFDPLSHRSSNTSPRRFMSLRRHYKVVSIHRIDQLQVHAASIQAGEEATPSLSSSPSMLNIQGAEQVHARV